jgi:O-Antigen ligase
VSTALALAAYAVLLAAAAIAVWRRPVVALYFFIVGLALHNAAMAGLYDLGLRGSELTAIQAWKEVLLTVAFARVGADAIRARRLPFRPGAVDALALAFAAAVVVYCVLPQGVLDGQAGAKARLLALRHDLVPVGAFFVGRSLPLAADQLRRLAWTIVGAAAAVAAVGLVEVYAVPIDWWRDSSVPAYFRDQLGYDYRGTGNLPENFVYNTGSEDHFLRRLVSVFLSPLGAAFMFVVALIVAAAGGPLARRKVLLTALGAICAAGLLFTFSRSSLLALAGGLVVLAFACRRPWLLGAAAATILVGIAFAQAFPSIAPRGDWTQADLVRQRAQAAREGGVEGGPLSTEEPSIDSHLDSLRDGLETVVTHPQGFGLGNAGTVAARTDVRLRAGESNYTELGVETGLLGLLLFVGWNLVLLAGLVGRARRPSAQSWAAAAVAASLAAVLALAVQTDTLGVPWLAVCVWWLAGSLATPLEAAAPERSSASRRPSARRPIRPPAEARP